MLYFNLRPIFRARGIEKPYTFLVKAGLSPHSANVVLNSDTRVLRLDHVELLCRVLVCEPNDLLLWKPDHDQVIAANHPLYKLKSNGQDDADLKQTLAAIPYQKLKEISAKIDTEIKEDE